jgi:hypothetical protein
MLQLRSSGHVMVLHAVMLLTLRDWWSGVGSHDVHIVEELTNLSIHSSSTITIQQSTFNSRLRIIASIQNQHNQLHISVYCL